MAIVEWDLVPDVQVHHFGFNEVHFFVRVSVTIVISSSSIVVSSGFLISLLGFWLGGGVMVAGSVEFFAVPLQGMAWNKYQERLHRKLVYINLEFTQTRKSERAHLIVGGGFTIVLH
jgi:hypothetical protein